MKHNIKAILVIIALICTALYSKIETTSNLYPASLVVIGTDEEQDLLYLSDNNGHVYKYKGIEDWFINDNAAAVMNNNGTLEVADDEIVKLRYVG